MLLLRLATFVSSGTAPFRSEVGCGGRSKCSELLCPGFQSKVRRVSINAFAQSLTFCPGSVRGLFLPDLPLEEQHGERP